jgi:hypothetical protein
VFASWAGLEGVWQPGDLGGVLLRRYKGKGAEGIAGSLTRAAALAAALDAGEPGGAHCRNHRTFDRGCARCVTDWSDRNPQEGS